MMEFLTLKPRILISFQKISSITPSGTTRSHQDEHVPLGVILDIF